MVWIAFATVWPCEPKCFDRTCNLLVIPEWKIYDFGVWKEGKLFQFSQSWLCILFPFSTRPSNRTGGDKKQNKLIFMTLYELIGFDIFYFMRVSGLEDSLPGVLFIIYHPTWGQRGKIAEAEKGSYQKKEDILGKKCFQVNPNYKRLVIYGLWLWYVMIRDNKKGTMPFSRISWVLIKAAGFCTGPSFWFPLLPRSIVDISIYICVCVIGNSFPIESSTLQNGFTWEKVSGSIKTESESNLTLSCLGYKISLKVN